MGVAWLAAAVLVVASGALPSVPLRWWWVVGAVAAVVSQGVILTAWSDAKAGTVANLILLAAVVYGYASQGPRSYRAEYRRRVDAALTEPLHRGMVGESDLAHLPEPGRDLRRTVGDVLASQKITVGPHDAAAPAAAHQIVGGCDRRNGLMSARSRAFQSADTPPAR
jgi:G5-linked-Ubiquitin-like domain